MKFCAVCLLLLLIAWSPSIWAGEYHVSPAGNDANEGFFARPYRTISAAAGVAQPGDVIFGGYNP
ncbi:MAG TPA: hypothetical protein PLP42_18220 [Acidobacteriota bacterium]|nr:hypothetical protein [Acidobacteriota bacterium]